MPLTTGTRLGPYEIVAPIGAGGMGEVYQGRDTRLDRIVAVKISAEQFTERFEREARAVAALNHPNVCTLHDVGPNYLVMEYIEGPTLAERIAAGPMPLAEALPIARQIAEALEAAHEKGIVHRDLKPGNVKVKPDGQVKVLDFGLAKAFESEAASGDPANSPTLTLAATRQGVILGTAAYMSPEQARGVVVDKRADIWAFGVVLLEMLTGRHTFEGETVSDTLASVLKTDPDWSALPPETPASIRRLLRRCLQRDRKRRLRDIGDVRLEIEEALSAPAEPVPAPALPPPHQRALLPWIVAAILLASTAWLAFTRGQSHPAESSYQVSLLPPEKAAFTQVQVDTGGIAVSPDGRTLAFIATQQGRSLLWVRRLDSLAARPLPGTDNAFYPFWSPDSRFLGFFAESRLKKIEVAGGPPQVLCDAPVGRGGTWSRDGVIVFGGIDRALHRVPAAGGQSVQLTALDQANQENAHYWPSFLPDGRHFLYLARSNNRDKSGIYVGSVDGKPGPGQHVEAVKALSNGVYAGGRLLYLRENTLFAEPFDVARLKPQGDAVPVAEHVAYAGNIALANFAVSGNGVLVYGHDFAQASRPMWADRQGKLSPVPGEPGMYTAPRLSPDATRLAVTRSEAQAGNMDVWLIDLAHAITTRFTFDPALDFDPVWSPDGKQIVFASTRETSSPKLFLKPASGTGNEERLLPRSNLVELPMDWSRDGRYVLYTQNGGTTGYDLFILPMTGERKAVPFLQTSFNEMQGQFSPDVRWVAYTSDESGRFEVYVRSFGGAPAKFQVSDGGGLQPRWRGDGKELYYVTADGKLMAATVKAAAGTFERDTPRQLVGARFTGPINAYTYDVTRDGQRFLFIQPPETEATEPLTLVVNWPAGLRR